MDIIDDSFDGARSNGQRSPVMMSVVNQTTFPANGTNNGTNNDTTTMAVPRLDVGNSTTDSQYDIVRTMTSQYDHGTAMDISSLRTSLSSSLATNTTLRMNMSMVDLTTSSPYIPDEFILENRMYFVPMITLMLVIGIIANILAIVATRHAIKIYRTHRSRKITIASYLIQCLMMVDLSAVLVFFIRGMFYTLYSDSFFKCDLDSVTNYFFSWSAGFVNAVMCLERCIALSAPFYYHSNASIGKAKIAVIVVLVLAFVTAMLPIFGIGSYKTLINGTYYCIGPGDFTLDQTGFDIHFGVIFLVIGIGILIFIHTCNAIVILKIIQIRRRSIPMRRKVKKDTDDGVSRKSARSTKDETSAFTNGMYETTSSSSTAANTDTPDGGEAVGHHSPLRGGDRRPRVKRPGRTEINVAKQIIVISVVFTISWLPFYVQRLLKAFEIEQPNWYLLVVIFLLVSNHIIDPFVFVFMKQQSRDALKDLCMRCVCCRRCRSTPTRNKSVNVILPLFSRSGGSQHVSTVCEQKGFGQRRQNESASRQNSGVVIHLQIDNPAANTSSTS